MSTSEIYCMHCGSSEVMIIWDLKCSHLHCFKCHRNLGVGSATSWLSFFVKAVKDGQEEKIARLNQRLKSKLSGRKIAPLTDKEIYKKHRLEMKALLRRCASLLKSYQVNPTKEKP